MQMNAATKVGIIKSLMQMIYLKPAPWVGGVELTVFPDTR